MANLTLALPEEVHRVVRKHPEVSWSHVARQAITEYARRIEMMDRLLVKSELSAEDVERIGRRVKAGIARRHRT